MEIGVPTEEGDALWGRADRNATMQILENLLSNAVKFSPPKNTVLVRTFSVSGSVSIAVRDQWLGISEDDHEKLFVKIARLSAQPTGGEFSTGLGLSIVKKLAEARSGTVIRKNIFGCRHNFFSAPACLGGFSCASGETFLLILGKPTAFRAGSGFCRPSAFIEERRDHGTFLPSSEIEFAVKKSRFGNRHSSRCCGFVAGEPPVSG